jgi:hypothetical protein
MSEKIILNGKYINPAGTVLEFNVFEGENGYKYVGFADNGVSETIAAIVPHSLGQMIKVTGADYENFKENVFNKRDVNEWKVKRGELTLTIPGRWTYFHTGGHKKRSRNKKKRNHKSRRSTRRHH